MIRRNSLTKKLTTYGILTLLTLCILFPLYWMFASSVKPPEELFTVPPKLFPTALTGQWYTKVLVNTNIPRFFFNSFIIAMLTTLVALVISVLAVYSFTRFEYPGKRALLLFMLFSYIIPPILLFLPFYMILSKLGLINSYFGIIATHLTLVTPFLIWLLIPFFNSIPKTLEEAAVIDGASIFQAFSKILLPLAVPGIFSGGIFAFTFSWNEFLYASVILTGEMRKTLPVGIAGFVSTFDIRWGSIMASGVLATVPVVVIFRLIQNYFIQGLTAGAVKE